MELVEEIKVFALPTFDANEDLEVSWKSIVDARVTKCEIVIAKAFTKTELKMDKRTKVVKGQLSAFVADCKAWNKPEDPMVLLWGPLKTLAAECT